MTPDLSINLRAPFRVERLGHEGEHVILIDGLLNRPEELIDYAAREATYGPAGASYPGLRGRLPAEYDTNVYNAVASLLNKVFDVPLDRPLSMDSTFALVTRAADKLRHTQRVPHIDRNTPEHLAMVLYLFKSRELGGTNFFRHRETGFERITVAREPEYQDLLNRQVNRIGPLPSVFPDETHPLFERIGCAEGVFNRIAIYRSWLLHSPAIPPRAEFSADPREGRLTVTSFLSPAGQEAPPPP